MLKTRAASAQGGCCIVYGFLSPSAEYFCRSCISRFVPCPFRSSSAQEKAPVRIDFRRSLGYTNHVGSL